MEYCENNKRTFYPQFCLDCQLNYFGIVDSKPCPICGCDNTVNYKHEIHRDIKKWNTAKNILIARYFASCKAKAENAMNVT